jgi:hypothetical protein
MDDPLDPIQVEGNQGTHLGSDLQAAAAVQTMITQQLVDQSLLAIFGLEDGHRSAS